jgi:hypothetical protein
VALHIVGLFVGRNRISMHVPENDAPGIYQAQFVVVVVVVVVVVISFIVWLAGIELACSHVSEIK